MASSFSVRMQARTLLRPFPYGRGAALWNGLTLSGVIVELELELLLGRGVVGITPTLLGPGGLECGEEVAEVMEFAMVGPLDVLGSP